jgi:YVTN family beta-propeller protein
VAAGARALRAALLGSMLLGAWLTSTALIEASPASAAATVLQTITITGPNGSAPMGCLPTGVSSDGSHVWVTCDRPNEAEKPGGSLLVELNASNGAEVADPDASLFNFSGVSSDGSHVWVAVFANSLVTELNASDGSVVQSIGVGANPASISSDGTHVWVANSGDNTVSELDASDGSVVQSIGAGTNPSGISSDGTHVWVANSGDNTVSELNASDGSVVQSIGVGGDPRGISSDGTHVWVADYTEGAVSEIGNPPSTAVVLPSNNATISGTQYLDASASSGVTTLVYEVSGGPSDLSDVQVATGTATIYGWLAAWRTTTVPNGTYSLQSVATSNGGSGTSAPVTITVNNPTPSTDVVIPSNNATVSGTSQVLDAAASSGVTQVQYEISGGTLTDSVIATATPTIYGWIALWNTMGVADGTYTLNSVASYADGVSGTSPPISLTVDNPATLADLAGTNLYGTGTATIENSCPYLVANVNYGAVNQTIGDVDLQIEGCYGGDFTGTFTITTTNAGTLTGTTSGSVATITPTPPGPMCPTPASCQPPYVQWTLTLTVTAGTGLFAGTTGALQVILTSPASAPPTDLPFTASVAPS